MIYFFIYIDNLSEHFLFLYSYLACIAQGNFSWATEKPNSNKVNKKQENDVLIFVLRCYPHLHRNTFVVTSKGQHVLPLKVMYVSLGVEICHARSGPHALPGGDFTGSFSKKERRVREIYLNCRFGHTTSFSISRFLQNAWQGHIFQDWGFCVSSVPT